MGVAEANEKADDDVLATMRWHIIPETGVVLLNPLVPLHYIYRHQHNAVVGVCGRGIIISSRIWSRRTLRKGRILEIGGGHGYLAAKSEAARTVLKFVLRGRSKISQHWTMVKSRFYLCDTRFGHCQKLRRGLGEVTS